MKVAVPTEKGVLCPHFGHCSEFTVFDVDRETKTIQQADTIPAPVHQPGLLPGWLAERGIEMVIAGGMGQRAIALFNAAEITVCTGALTSSPEDLVMEYLNESLQLTENTCDNTGHSHHQGQCGTHS